MVIFLAMIAAIIVKDRENKKAVDEAVKNTIQNALQEDSGNSIEEIADTYKKETLEKVEYGNIEDEEQKKDETNVLAEKTYNIDVNDYFPVDWVLENNVTDSDYGDQTVDCLMDFIQDRRVAKELNQK